jgi:hypothetical protein
MVNPLSYVYGENASQAGYRNISQFKNDIGVPGQWIQGPHWVDDSISLTNRILRLATFTNSTGYSHSVRITMSSGNKSRFVDVVAVQNRTNVTFYGIATSYADAQQLGAGGLGDGTILLFIKGRAGVWDWNISITDPNGNVNIFKDTYNDGAWGLYFYNDNVYNEYRIAIV